jgi:hypothetical protein
MFVKIKYVNYKYSNDYKVGEIYEIENTSRPHYNYNGFPVYITKGSKKLIRVDECYTIEEYRERLINEIIE